MEAIRPHRLNGFEIDFFKRRAASEQIIRQSGERRVERNLYKRRAAVESVGTRRFQARHGKLGQRRTVSERVVSYHRDRRRKSASLVGVSAVSQRGEGRAAVKHIRAERHESCGKRDACQLCAILEHICSGACRGGRAFGRTDVLDAVGDNDVFQTAVSERIRSEERQLGRKRNRFERRAAVEHIV